MKLSELVMQKNPASNDSEAYRILRTNLVFISAKQTIKTILITSTMRAEGRTSVAGNLAMAIAQLGKKVLLIDGDFRKEKRRKGFPVGNRGLSYLIMNPETHYSEVLKLAAVNLFFLPSGPLPLQPTELLALIRMREVLEELRTAFDYIIIDSPALLGVADAQILASYTDGVVLVVCAGKSRFEAVQSSKKLLLNVNANLLGVVLTRF